MTGPRAAALLGLLVGALIAVWWLAATFGGGAIARAPAATAAAALDALWLVDALVLALLLPRLGATSAADALPTAINFVVIPAPLAVLLWAATGASAVRLAAAGAALIAGAAVLVATGRFLARLPLSPQPVRGVATVLGAGLAGLLFATRDHWLGWLA